MSRNDPFPKPFEVFEDTRSLGKCRACLAPLAWYKTVGGKNMPLERDAVAGRTAHDASGRLVGYYAGEDSHFANCRYADTFRQPRPAPAGGAS